MRRALALLVLFACCAGPAIDPAVSSAKGMLDPSFGEGGVVDLTTGLDGEPFPSGVAPAPDGSVFVVESRFVCSHGGCPVDVYLRRYTPGGERDGRFGDVFVGRANYGALLVVDHRGRPLLAWERKSGGIVVRRLQPDGRPDRSFGDGGAVSVKCDCRLDDVSVAPGGGVLVSGDDEFRRSSSLEGSIWVFIRLRGDGRLDPGFGGDGRVRLPMPGYYEPAVVATPGGGFALATQACCGGYRAKPFVTRLSARGRLDRAYGTATRRSLRRFDQAHRGEAEWGLVTIPRTGGRLEIYAGGYYHGSALRLLPDGRRDPSFGTGGSREFEFGFGGAVTDGAGGTFVAAFKRGSFGVDHLLPNGAADPAFGRVPVPEIYSEDGISIQPQGPGAALLFGDGFFFCRTDCHARPAMARVLSVR